jgi:hypothetical protein
MAMSLFPKSKDEDEVPEDDDELDEEDDQLDEDGDELDEDDDEEEEWPFMIVDYGTTSAECKSVVPLVVLQFRVFNTSPKRKF